MNRFNVISSVRVLLVILTLSLVEGRLQAGFIYDITQNPRDLLFGIRVPGGSSDVTVNMGNVTNYSGLPPGTTVTVTNLSTNQLALAFPNLNGVSWSVSGAVRTNGIVGYPLQTFWATAARTDLNTQTVPWLRKSQLNQGNVAGNIDAIGQSAYFYANSQPDGPANTSTGVIIPSSDMASYGNLMTTDGNFNGTFQGNAENTTPDNFSASGVPVRSDFYELVPGAGATLNTPGTYLGYFEFRPDGTMTFTAAGGQPTVPQPTITAIRRTGNLATISFTTVSGATYTLRHTNSAGLTAPVANWTPGTGSVAGDGLSKSLQDDSNDADRFFVVVASGGTSGSQPVRDLSRTLLVNSW